MQQNVEGGIALQGGGLSVNQVGFVPDQSSKGNICLVGRASIMGSSKKKVQVWKRALLHFFLCFIVGVLTGLTPFSMATFSANLAHNNRPKARQDFAFELKNMPTNARQDFSQVGNRGRLIETIKIEVAEISSEKGLGLEDAEGEKNSSQSLESSPLGNLSSVGLSDFVPRKLVIVVTPYHSHPFQALYLNRLAHTLRLVPPPLLWIVVEMQAQSMETAGILRKTGVMYRHLVCVKNETDVKDRNTHMRNVALAHIEQHQLEGIVFFADGSNVYTLELFERLRKIRHFGTWPVGILTHNKNKVILQGPVCNSTKVIGWHTDERSKGLCRFHAGMSGFAFNSTLLWDPLRRKRPTLEPIRQLDIGKDGFQESTFIEQVVEDESQMEGMPDGCSKVMVWNLHLETSRLVYPSGWIVEKNLDANVPLKQHPYSSLS